MPGLKMGIELAKADMNPLIPKAASCDSRLSQS